MIEHNKIRRRIQDAIKESIQKNIGNARLPVDELRKKDLFCIKELEIEGDYVIVKLQGAVDSSTIPFAQKQSRNYKDQLDKHIIVDFKDAGRIDCSTLAILVELFTELKSNHKKLIIINATKELIGYTDILHLRPFISILKNKKQALAYLS